MAKKPKKERQMPPKKPIKRKAKQAAKAAGLSQPGMLGAALLGRVNKKLAKAGYGKKKKKR